MTDIELVIKIPEELYKAYKGRPPMLGDAGMDMIAQSIANGTPLPKGQNRSGEWILDPEISLSFSLYRCSNCNNIGANEHFNYCPYCGAKMEEKK